MNKTQIENMIDGYARWVRRTYNTVGDGAPKPSYPALLTQAAKAACHQLHGDDRLGVGAMKSAISAAHWKLRRKPKVGVKGYQQGTLPF